MGFRGKKAETDMSIREMQVKGKEGRLAGRETRVFPQIRGRSPRKPSNIRANSTRNRNIYDEFALCNSTKSPNALLASLFPSPHRVLKPLHTATFTNQHRRTLSTTVSPIPTSLHSSLNLPPFLEARNAIQTPSSIKESSAVLEMLLDEDLLTYYERQLHANQGKRGSEEGWAVSEYGRRSLLRTEMGGWREVEDPEISDTPVLGREKQQVAEKTPILKRKGDKKKGRREHFKATKRNMRK